MRAAPMHAGLFITLSLTCSCSRRPAPEAKTPAPEPVRITQFYASPPNPAVGERSMLCYGTENAASVQLDPPEDRVWPSPSRCIEVFPKKSVTYTLTASRGEEKVSQSLTIAPGPLRPELVKVDIPAKVVPKGTSVSVCYQAKNATKVTVTPGTWLTTESPRQGCIQHVMQETTTFKVRVLDKDGTIADGEDVEIQVQ
jgi:hypothetical protein